MTRRRGQFLPECPGSAGPEPAALGGGALHQLRLARCAAERLHYGAAHPAKSPGTRVPQGAEVRMAGVLELMITKTKQRIELQVVWIGNGLFKRKTIK